MKLSSGKPVLSPGRTDKFPPPLMRFLRTNGSSRSRGRTARASPMFMRKKTSSSSASTSAVETTQEPSSPKVTCIGQVRVRRSKSKSGNRRPITGSRKSATSRCYCVRKSMFCDPIHVKLRRPRSFRPAWREWVFFFRCRTGAKVKTDSPREDSGGVRVDRFGGINYEEEEEEEEEEEGESRELEGSRCGGGYESASSTPPKNAFLLTRCRSAPYRSSSLAGQFWGSPLKTEEEGTPERRQEDRERTATDDRKESEASPTSGSEPPGRDLSAESRGDHREREGEEEKILGLCEEEEEEEEEEGGCDREKGEESEGAVNTNEGKVNVSELRRKFEESTAEMNTTACLESRRRSGDLEKSRSGIDGFDDGGGMRPLILLKRCKSEPASRGMEKFDPEISKFWRQTRLRITTESGTPLVVD